MTVDLHERHEHAALLHDGPDDLVERVTPIVADALERGDAVLVCVEDPVWERLQAAIGPAADAVAYLPAGERYSTPGAAMASVHRFALDALDRGAAVAVAVGAIPFDGRHDERWLRYEAAVSEVLGHLPLRGYCLYDTATTPPALVDAARRAHGPPPVDAPGLGDVLPEPAEPPVLDAEVAAAAVVRRLLREQVGGALGDERLHDLQLVATELVSNGLRHGAGAVRFRTWQLPGEVVVEVRDQGAGLADPYPDLRPPRGDGSTGGYGLWLVGQLVDRFSATRDGTTTSVRAGLRC